MERHSSLFDLWGLLAVLPGFAYGFYIKQIMEMVKRYDSSLLLWLKAFSIATILPSAICIAWAAFGLSMMDGYLGIKFATSQYLITGLILTCVSGFTGRMLRWVLSPYRVSA